MREQSRKGVTSATAGQRSGMSARMSRERRWGRGFPYSHQGDRLYWPDKVEEGAGSSPAKGVHHVSPEWRYAPFSWRATVFRGATETRCQHSRWCLSLSLAVGGEPLGVPRKQLRQEPLALLAVGSESVHGDRDEVQSGCGTEASQKALWRRQARGRSGGTSRGGRRRHPRVDRICRRGCPPLQLGEEVVPGGSGLAAGSPLWRPRFVFDTVYHTEPRAVSWNSHS